MVNMRTEHSMSINMQATCKGNSLYYGLQVAIVTTLTDHNTPKTEATN